MKTLIFTTIASFAATAAAAQTCALDDADFVPPANDSSAPAADVVLMSIGLDADGEFAVESAQRANGLPSYAWQLDDMLNELQPHDAGDSENATPFDMELSRDTIVVFQLKPGAWKWEADAEKALFLKEGQSHDPFTTVDEGPGQPRMMAVRFHADDALAGCSYEYNLGVVVNQGGKKTPLIIDPRIENGGGDGN